MKNRFEKPLSSNLGKDPETGSDAEFYDWITQGNPDNALGSVAAALIEELRDDTSAEELTTLLDDWKERLSEAEFVSRLAMMERLMPPGHAYHGIKSRYLKKP